MRTALVCAICFFCGASLFAPSRQIFNIGPSRSGPYALRGVQLWSVGPLADMEPFVIPAQPPTAPVVILTGMAGGGLLEKQLQDGTWERVATTGGNGMLGMRPGLRLSPGTYRPNNGGSIAFGYYAPSTGGSYPGSDTYPDQSRIWQCQPTIDQSFEFNVPSDKVYVVNYVYHHLQKWDGSNWVEVIAELGYDSSATPGFKLAPGQYRVGYGVITDSCVSGYITTEN